MTENVLSNIFESLSLDDVAAAETQITEWFDSVSLIKEEASGSYVLESEAFFDSAAVWGFESPDDASLFVSLYENGGGQFQVRIIDASEAAELPTTLAPAGCMSGLNADALAVWMQENGTDGFGYAVSTVVNDSEVAEGNKVVDSGNSDELFDVEDDSGKRVGMGMDKESAKRYAKYHGNLPKIGGMEEAVTDYVGDENMRADLVSKYDDDSLPVTGDRVRINGKTGVVGKMAETDTYGGPAAYVVNFDDGTSSTFSVDDILEETRTNISVVEAKEESEEDDAEKVEESINTTRRCGECGEVDAAMDEDAEFCDQCIQEANERNPDLMGESVDPALADLVEQFKGFTVVDKLSNKEGAQVGNADAIQVNDKSPVPNIKAAKRVGGAPVEIKADEHKGFEAEKAPAVKDAKVKNPAPKAERKEVADGGDKSALLNKEEGKGNDISPIGSKSRD